MAQPQPQQRLTEEEKAAHRKRFGAEPGAQPVEIGQLEDTPTPFTPAKGMDLPPGMTWEDYEAVISREAGKEIPTYKKRTPPETGVVQREREVPVDAAANRLWDYDETLSMDAVADGRTLTDVREAILYPELALDDVITMAAGAIAARVSRENRHAETCWKNFTQSYRNALTNR